MSDAEFLFNQQSYGAKRLARGAYSKKNGCRSKKCTLPSDRLTKKELKERNGKMSHYKMREPMSWAEFKDMPDDLQREYLQFLSIEKNARIMDIAAMFGVNANYLSNILAKKPWIAGMFPRGKKHPSPEWMRFVGEADSEPSEASCPDAVSEPVEEPKQDDAPPAEVKLDGPASTDRGSVMYSGLPAAIFEKAYQLLDKEDEYTVLITFNKKTKEE